MHVTRRDDAITMGPVWVSGMLLVMGLVVGATSFVSYESMRSAVDAAAMDGRADPLTPAVFRRITMALRVAGGCFALVAAGVMIWRRPLAAQGRRLLESGNVLMAAARDGLTAWRRHEPLLHRWTWSGIVVTAAALRVAFLFQPMRYDEAFTYLAFASKPWYVGLAYYEPNNHIFHTMLAHASATWFGPWPWAIRLPACLAGMLAVPMTYVAVRRLYHQDIALWTAGWMATAPVFVEYATNARGYSIGVLVFVAALALAHRLKREDNLAAWAAVVFLAVIGLYTLPTMLYAFGALFVWLGFSALAGDATPSKVVMMRRLAGAGVWTVVLAAVCYSPVVMAQAFGRTASFAVPRSWPAFIDEIRAFLPDLWAQWHHGLPPAVGGLLAAGAVIGLARHRWVARDHLSLLAVAGLWCVVMWLVLRPAPLLPRHLLAFAPLYIATAGAGWWHLLGRSSWLAGTSRRRAVALATIVWMAVTAGSLMRDGSLQTVTPQEQFPDAQAMVLFLHDYAKPGDVLVAGVPADAPLEYYGRLHGLPRMLLDGDINHAERVLVVEHSPWERLPTIVGRIHLPRERFGPPRVIRRFTDSALYEMRRIDEVTASPAT